MTIQICENCREPVPVSDSDRFMLAVLRFFANTQMPLSMDEALQMPCANGRGTVTDRMLTMARHQWVIRKAPYWHLTPKGLELMEVIGIDTGAIRARLAEKEQQEMTACTA